MSGTGRSGLPGLYRFGLFCTMYMSACLPKQSDREKTECKQGQSGENESVIGMFKSLA